MNLISHKLEDLGVAIKGWKVVGFLEKANTRKSFEDIRVCQPYMGNMANGVWKAVKAILGELKGSGLERKEPWWWDESV